MNGVNDVACHPKFICPVAGKAADRAIPFSELPWSQMTHDAFFEDGTTVQHFPLPNLPSFSSIPKV